jgi:hypothetical protein
MRQEDLQNARRQIDEVKATNRELEAKLLLEGNGKRNTVPTKQKSTKCMVVGDSILRNVGEFTKKQNYKKMKTWK